MNETIVAVSSAPGFGTLGIVRLSGSRAFEIAARLCSGVAMLSRSPGSRRVSGEVRVDEGLRLPAAFYVFRAPHSYTREDLIEIHTVGSPVALDLVREACVAYGALPAEPGEFTARAFFNGAMDLARAEAVAGVISAQSDVQLRASRRMMDGALARQLTTVRDQLGELLALVEADIDFAEEPIEFITPGALQERLLAVVLQLDGLIDSSPADRLDQLPRILLLGRPNAGKSSLMNRLSGTRRAICAAAAGTTRDILAAPIRLGRGEAMLLDSAGVDESEDDVIAQARRMTLTEAERVDLVCLVIDATRLERSGVSPDLGHFLAEIRRLELPATVIAVNKVDLVTAGARAPLIDRLRGLGIGEVASVSALTGEGIEDLRELFLERIGGAEITAGSEAILMTARQRSSMHDAAKALRHAAELAAGATETIDCADLLAFELREALDHLGAVTGAVTTEDILTHVFANFCIGK